MGLSATVRRSAAEATLALPFRIPLREWFTLRQAGEALGLSESTVEKLYDAGKLTGHSHNAGRGEREHKRILRLAVVAYAMRTADYDDGHIEGLVDDFVGCMRHLPAPLVLRASEQLRRIATERPCGAER